MRLIAFLATLAALAAAAFAGRELYDVVQTPPQAQVPSAQVASGGAALTGSEPQPPRQWPALFGTATQPEPQPPAPPTPPKPPDEPQPPAPPIESLGYRLKGVVSTTSGDWAIVSHPTGELLLTIGDALAEGVTVTAIDVEGLWVDNSGEQALLAFEE